MRIEVEGWGDGDNGARQKQQTLIVLILVAITCWTLMLIYNDNLLDTSGLTKKEQRMASRIHKIAQESGGEWQNVSPEDRQFLTFEVSYGDENSARMVLSASAGKLSARPKANSPARVR